MRTAKKIALFEGLDSYPTVLDDENTVLWVDAQENVTKDGSDKVSVWGDKSGNDNDLLQTTETDKPLWSADGILFDGVDDFMKAVSFTLVQPEQIYIVFKQVTWVDQRYVFDGNSSYKGLLSQIGTTPNIVAYAGSISSEDSNLALGAYGIVRVLFNLASSKLIVNGNTPITFDCGFENMSGFTLGGSGSGDRWCNVEVKEIIIRKVADTPTDEQAIYDYLASKYSI